MTKETTETTDSKKATYFNVFAEKQGQTKRDDRLIRIGAAFPHKKGPGFNVEIESMPLNFTGKLVILLPKEKDDKPAE